MKFKFEGSEAEFRALFGARTTDGDILPALTAIAAAPAAATAEIKSKYKIGDTVQLTVPEIGEEYREYNDFWCRNNNGQVKITEITGDGYYVNGEMIVQDEHILRKLGKHALPPDLDIAKSGKKPASISTAVRNNNVYPYLARAITQHLQFPAPVPATERELRGLGDGKLAKAREPGF